MLAIFRLLLVICVSLLPVLSFGGGGALVRNIEFVFKAGNYVKVARLTGLSSRDLRFASKVDNVNGLLELAEMEHRINPIQMMRLSRTYASTANGDEMLLICLRTAKCQPEQFLSVANTSRLHAEVVKRIPTLGLIQAHHVVGALNESLMIRYFEHSGWTRVEGQVGRTGFDGLFVKLEDGVIKDVLIVESKYNTSSLQSTNFGIQMSEDWIRRKMVELKERFPSEVIYQKIDPFIEANAYRAVLWNLKVEEDALNIGLSKLKGKGGAVDIAVAVGTDVESLSAPFANSVKFNAPRNKFEEQVVRWYNDELVALTKVTYK
jgi:hypothetical protein